MLFISECVIKMKKKMRLQNANYFFPVLQIITEEETSKIFISKKIKIHLSKHKKISLFLSMFSTFGRLLIVKEPC